MYAAGRGVPKDRVEAYQWFHLSADQGDKYAVEYRRELVAEMTPEQIAEAKKRAAAFVPKKNPPKD